MEAYNIKLEREHFTPLFFFCVYFGCVYLLIFACLVFLCALVWVDALKNCFSWFVFGWVFVCDFYGWLVWVLMLLGLSGLYRFCLALGGWVFGSHMRVGCCFHLV